MILVICGTNRPKSKTSLVAKYAYNQLKELGQNVHYVSMEDYAEDIVHSNMYEADQMSKRLMEFQDNYFIPATKLIIISPEYNGSFPGILKTFIDALSVRKYADTFEGKKAALVGVASGRAGNLRGMEQLTGFLHYLKVHVYPVKLPISQIGSHIVGQDLVKQNMKPLEDLLTDFLEY